MFEPNTSPFMGRAGKRSPRRFVWRRSSRLLQRTALLVLVVLTGLAATSWKQAAPGYHFQFPRDHASHPDYRIEWWYYTGNLHSADGRWFGYQLTFFRVGVDRNPVNPSIWAVRDLFLAHLAVTDTLKQRFYFDEKLNRAGPGWAGASTAAYQVWNDRWKVDLDARGRHLLLAESKKMGVRLVLEPGKPPVLHGDRGYSRKGESEGNASLYYSLTRMPTQGTVLVDGEEISVEGLSWMDHEFGTSFLESGQVGWDWMSIQLDDGTDLMVYQLRKADGTKSSRSSGTFVDIDGMSDILKAPEFEMLPLKQVDATASGARYPEEWVLHIPRLKLNLTVSPVLLSQEFRGGQTGLRYWEGAVTVAGTRFGKTVRGRGYLEMTGYAGGFMSDLLH